MKHVRVTCDVCGKQVPRDTFGDHDFVSVRMQTSGYGLHDGDHRHRYDVCSSPCGLAALNAIVVGIDRGEAPVLSNGEEKKT